MVNLVMGTSVARVPFFPYGLWTSNQVRVWFNSARRGMEGMERRGAITFKLPDSLHLWRWSNRRSVAESLVLSNVIVFGQFVVRLDLWQSRWLWWW